METGVAERLREAQVLFSTGHKEGALLPLLVAVAATARKRYPKKRYSDRTSFTAFLKDEMSGGSFWGPRIHLLAKMPFKGKNWPLEDIIYEMLRCKLGHEAELSLDIRYDPAKAQRFILRITDDDKFVFQDALLACLSHVVLNASENLGAFEGDYLPPRSLPSVVIGSPSNPLIICSRSVEVPIV